MGPTSKTTVSMAISWISLLLVLFLNLNLAVARRIPTTTYDDVIQISLENKGDIEEKVIIYSRIALKCEFDNPLWFKNGEKLPVEIRRNKIIKFDKIKKTDAGIYTCRSEDNRSSNLTLSVLPGGEIKKNFNSNMKVFSQVAENVTEQNEHLDLNNDDNADDSEDYTDKEQTKESIEGFKPVFRLKSMVRTIVKPSGSYVKIICSFDAHPTPNVTWTKEGKPITRTMGEVHYKKWSVQMEDVIPEDSGLYKCEVCNIYGCVDYTTKLIIQDRLRSRPIIAEGYPKNLTLLVNMTGRFECKVLTDLEPFITWVKHDINGRNDSNITSSETVIRTSIDEIRNHSIPGYVVCKTDPEMPHILRLVNVTYEDEGWYTCVAANSLGASTASAYLHVTDEIIVNEAPSVASLRNQWFTVATALIILLCFFGAIIMFMLRKWRHDKLIKHRMETVHQWTKKVVIYKPSPEGGTSDEMIMPIIKIKKQRTTLLQNSNSDPAPFNEYEFPLDSTWEIPRHQLVLGDTLGEGAFGRVVMAEALGIEGHGKSTIVAVKMVKEGHTDADMACLVREMEVMKMIGKHKNIINLLGCCSQDGPLYVIVEYAPYGNLKDFLKANKMCQLPDDLRCGDEKDQKVLTQKDLISFAYQVARGMEYLASRRCIHRDLAARNVLVSDDYVMKIADFGLARDIQDTDYYRKNTNGRLPIKWMAPESLQDKFYDTKSDVWSFGVLLWEIMTFGDQPYPKVTAEELYGYLLEGNRMEKPYRCSLNIYLLMRQCWNFDADARPRFSEIVENLDKILTSTANANEEYLDLSVPLLETPPSSGDESDTETFRETLLRYH
ncbi:fibroblast growth factor receptor homolog 1-like isoform X1 [Hermetia illucens]|uniref:fibroblast growth factor receptor homolog 1-like isoform X1 n=1 Tax=Hermetia illucens TaxID=343691 RepID=UPI0018CBFEBD|nr:fibroblast growth factor receptor homolog 1-like isoform X1 [Hermetia illucens]XP_037920344.1 fibroblast growth factor receptor homolog 1-like isoform X1 [Hermetia illucens]